MCRIPETVEPVYFPPHRQLGGLPSRSAKHHSRCPERAISTRICGLSEHLPVIGSSRGRFLCNTIQCQVLILLPKQVVWLQLCGGCLPHPQALHLHVHLPSTIDSQGSEQTKTRVSSSYSYSTILAKTSVVPGSASSLPTNASLFSSHSRSPATGSIIHPNLLSLHLQAWLLNRSWK